jgi:V8-like Glu-specific endopeptidase
VVLTAAHCVTGGPGKAGATQWAANWMFVPGFVDGLLPYGEYTARRFFVSKDWTGPQGRREQYDAAFVQVTTATLYGMSVAAQPPPGLPVKFAGRRDAAPLGRRYVFGYPAELPYSGLYLNYCAGSAVASGGSVRTPCGMTAGDSGGPWLAGFSPRSGSGQVVAVSTYKARALRAGGQLSSLIWRASAKSFSVSPPAECVIRVSVTAFHAIRTSG